MTIHGFELVEERAVPEINSQAKLYRHAKTGARLLSLENEDENKVFGIAFATLPEDSTGLPHILEHSILCGSESYPVREPFKELLKGSLNTFLNAFTAPDKTIYPVASQNRADFHNLVKVYLDAVFKPFITPQTLQIQGWHYELANHDAPLTYKGVVFNEMKGVYSSPDSLIGCRVQQSVFPDNLYGLDAGGDPAVIPDLTFAQLRSFYERHYHPSNAMIFFHGDDRSDERLRLVDDYLSQYGRTEPAPRVPLQPRFSAPRHFVYGYDAGETAEDGGDASAIQRRGYVTAGWLLNEITDVDTTLALGILSHILVGTPASPLRKALIDSGLGEDLTGGGYDNSCRQAIFSVGLKGIDPFDSGAVERLIENTLAGLARDGIDPDTVAASLNTTEFALREANTGTWPRGVIYMFAALGTWQHGGDPVAGLAFESPLARIRARAAANPRFFEDLIKTHLLNNPHRGVVLLKPDPEARARTEAAERARLDKARAAMSRADLQGVQDDMRRLAELQERPDSPEALATIPSLRLSDLDRGIRRIPLAADTRDGMQVLRHVLPTSGIVYLDVGFNLRALPQGLLPYAGLFGRLMTDMGTAAQDFVKLSQRIGRETGGISVAKLTSTTCGGEHATWLFLRGKATAARGQALLDILRDVLLTVRLDNKERLRQIVLEEKAGTEANLLPVGTSFVMSRLRAHFSVGDWVGEQLDGVSHLLFLRRLAGRIESDWPGVLADLEAVRRALVNRPAILCNVTAEEGADRDFMPRLQGFMASLPATVESWPVWSPRFPEGSEGLTLPAQVNYVGKGANLYRLGYRLKGSALAIVKFLDTTWMWDRIRGQGGAYGASLVFDNLSGTLGYLSYRDPNLLNSLQTYDATAAHLRATAIDSAEIERIIIGVIGQMDTYRFPDAKGFTSLARHLTGYTDDIRQRLRDEVFATTADDFRAFADVLDRVAREGVVVVMGSERDIAAANQTLADKLAVTRLM